MAEPLSHYLSSSGTYHGFDISSETMNFCRSLISHPGFSFTSINLHHPIYNPSGKIKPEKFSFPFKDDTFDVAIAASIFSHLGLAAAKRYLAELRRVLRPGGRAIISFFAVPEQEKQTQGGITNILGAGDGEYAYRFLKVENGYYIHCDKTGTPKSHYVNSPEGDPVAFDADALIGLAKEVELDCLHFLEGAWKFTEYVHGWQDIVVLQKHDAD
jgi:SAM-dependent methyltransferase